MRGMTRAGARGGGERGAKGERERESGALMVSATLLPCRFRENFKNTSWVKVPKVLWEYSSPEVLTLEYVPGEPPPLRRCCAGPCGFRSLGGRREAGRCSCAGRPFSPRGRRFLSAGVKINDAAALDRMGLDRKRLARLSVESYLQQILRHGFFHADP